MFMTLPRLPVGRSREKSQAFRQMNTFIITGIRTACTLARKLGQMRVCEIIECWSYEESPPDAGKATLLPGNEDRQLVVLSQQEEKTSATYNRPPGPDKHSVVVKIAADTEDELKAKLALLDVIIKQELKDTPVTEIPVEKVALVEEDLPAVGSEPLGGITWIGTMGPTSRWAEALEKIYPLHDKYRLRRSSVMPPF
jgi:hypothetical protein